jgi:hypothetical protein
MTIHTQHDCFVIGSGPSLEGFDFDRLPAAFRIGANKSAWLAKCDVLVSVDRRFHSEFRKQIEAFPGDKFMARAEDEPIPGVTYAAYERGDGLSESISTLKGTNSGFAALNVAYILGYKRIGLLGFDFQWTGGKSHFHDGYTWQNKAAHRHLRTWARAFPKILPQLTAKGVEVINYVGPEGSGIDVFEKRPLCDLI